MKTSIMSVLVALGMLLCFSGCDKDRDPHKNYFSPWTKTEETRTYAPSVGPHFFQWISYADRTELEFLLALPPVEGISEEGPIRTVHTSSEWVLVKYIEATSVTPLKIQLDGIWISYSDPITIEYRTTYTPRPTPRD